jgi:hypothetical protein
MHEVHRPALVDRCRRDGPLSPYRTPPSFGPFPLQRKAFFALQTLDELPVHRPTLAA